MGPPSLYWGPTWDPMWLHWPHTHASALGSAIAIPLSNFSFSDLPESCSYEGRVFQDGEDWPLSSCAKCMCRNGVTQCFTAQCQPLFCNKVSETASEWILPRLLTSLYRIWSPFWDYVRPPWKFRNQEPRLFCFPYTFGDNCWDLDFTLRGYSQSNYQPFRLIVTLWNWALRVSKRKLPTPVADVPKLSSSTSGKFSRTDCICYCRTMHMLLFEAIYVYVSLDMIIYV